MAFFANHLITFGFSLRHAVCVSEMSRDHTKFANHCCLATLSALAELVDGGKGNQGEAS